MFLGVLYQGRDILLLVLPLLVRVSKFKHNFLFMERINLALDWTPNINHIGFFVAEELGIFSDLGLEVYISDPSLDKYTLTPAKKVELGIADFALCPTESIISYQTKSKTFRLVGVSAILQEDLSSIAVLKNSKITSPKDLDGKSYASYHARYEDEIVRQMIRNDGGQGELEITYPDKLGIWNTVNQGKSDSTWIFMNWEGVAAEQNGVELHHFKMSDYDIPYSYSPIMVTDEHNIRNREYAYQRFLEGCKKGFLYTLKEQEESLRILHTRLAATDKKIDLKRCLEMTAPYFGNSSNWGMISESRMGEFLEWLYKNNLESKRLNVRDLYTNSLLRNMKAS